MGSDTNIGSYGDPRPQSELRKLERADYTSLKLDEAFWNHKDLVSDKWLSYLGVYDAEITRACAKGGPIRLLEIGVQNGGSLQIWSKVLPVGSQVVGIDTNPRCAELPFGGDVRIIVGDATDRDSVNKHLTGELFELVIDDGSHVSPNVIASFFVCFPLVAPGGAYIIEDLHASYWTTHLGGFRRPGSSIEFLKGLVDALNSDHFDDALDAVDVDVAELRALGEWIERVSFFDSIAVIQKRSEPKRHPQERILTGARAEIAPVLEVILANPAQLPARVLASQLTIHTVDMQMLQEVHERRSEVSELRVQLANTLGELSREKDKESAARESLDKALVDTELARQEAIRKIETIQRDAQRHVSLARIQRDNARVNSARELALAAADLRAAIAQRDEAVVRGAAIIAQCDELIARVVAIETSGFWRLTAPARRLLDAFPVFHTFSQTVFRAAYRVLRKESPRALGDDAISPVGPIGPARCDVNHVATEQNASLSGSTLTSPFDALHALRSFPIPEDQKRCFIVPFRTATDTMQVPRIAVVVHAFYVERLTAILERIVEIPGFPDVFVTTDTEDKKTQITDKLVGWRFGHFEVRVVPNRGRDIAAKLFGLGDIYDKYDLVLHLHTKKSTHAEGGDDWFYHMLQTLAGSEQVIRSVLAAFAAQPKLGLLFADHWDPIVSYLNWGYNFEIARDLAGRIDIDLSREAPLEFPSGSMFWARPMALSPLLSLQLAPDDFPEEAGQVDGTVAHAIERLFLFACERAGYSWISVAHADLYRGNEERAVHVITVDKLHDALQRHPVLVTDPAFRKSSRVLTDYPETWPIRFVPEFDDRPRLNLLIPTFRASSVFGGIATAYELFDRIADSAGGQIERRLVITTEDAAIAPEDLPSGWSPADPLRADGDRSVVFLPRGRRVDQGLSVRRNDIFFASAWWDAAASFGLLDMQRRFFGAGGRVRYFIQDYEPNFSAWSASWAMAEQTYHRPEDTVAMVNSQFLHDHLQQLKLVFSEEHVFQPIWNKELGPPDASPTSREDLILVYWRPHVVRNLGPIVASGLARWLEDNPYEGRRWTILAIGQDGDDVRLTDWQSMKCLGKLTLSTYAELLRRAKVGVALMLSPHPSYPPLEMAAFGMRVITNHFGPKDLSQFGNGIESLGEASPAAIAAALHRATEAWAPTSFSEPYFDFGSAFSKNIDLDNLADSVARGIRSEIRRS
jgi:hypothetical protein